MQRVWGRKVTEGAQESCDDRRRLAELLVRTLLVRPMISTLRETAFHCDPHAGNLLLTDERRLAVLDWSLVGQLTDEHRTIMVHILLAAQTLRGDKVIRLVAGLADRGAIDCESLKSVVQASMQQIRCGQFAGLTWLVGLLDEAVRSARLRLAADLMLFRKTLHTLEGVIAEIAPERFRMDDVLRWEFLKQFAAELPNRWVTPAGVTGLRHASFQLRSGRDGVCMASRGR